MWSVHPFSYEDVLLLAQAKAVESQETGKLETWETGKALETGKPETGKPGNRERLEIWKAWLYIVLYIVQCTLYSSY